MVGGKWGFSARAAVERQSGVRRQTPVRRLCSRKGAPRDRCQVLARSVPGKFALSNRSLGRRPKQKLPVAWSHRTNGNPLLQAGGRHNLHTEYVPPAGLDAGLGPGPGPHGPGRLCFARWAGLASESFGQQCAVGARHLSTSLFTPLTTIY